MATVFVGGSALLLAGAMAALAFGFANGEDSLVWTALIASAGAAVFLVIAYFVSRRELNRAGAPSETEPDPATTAPQRSSEEHPSGSVASPAQSEATDAPERETELEEDRATDTDDGASKDAVGGTPAAAALAGGGPTAKPSTSKRSSSPGTASAAKPSSPGDAVVGIASKKKFHRPECRYAKSAGSGEEMTRATARKRGFAPCGICKP